MIELQKKPYTINIGVDDFKKMATSTTLFVDKTSFISTLLESGYHVTLITRPRRWGKTLNMTMLQYFFSIPVKSNGEIDEEEQSKKHDIFSKLKIGKQLDIIKGYCGKYPVIFISFKDAKATTFEEMQENIADLIQELYKSHRYLLESPKLDDIDKDEFKRYITGPLTNPMILKALKTLSYFLFKHFNQKVFILIDEYDTPLNDWYALQLARETLSDTEDMYFQNVLNLFRGIFSSALKGNDSLEKGVVTGILRVAKASLFSGLNNFGEDSILDENYAEHFGFTETEVNSLLYKSGLDQNPGTAQTLKSWYNGYNIGGFTIYNPWSIMNCLNNKGAFKAYWVGTASTTLIENALILDKFQEEMQMLIEGEKVDMIADPKMVFADIKSSPNALYNLLLFSGYLTAEKAKLAMDGITYLCSVKIPNYEVRGVFMTSAIQWIENKFKTDARDYKAFVTHLLRGDVPKFMETLKSYLGASASYFDSGPKQAELLYNGFMWGLFASSVNEDYFVEKERETGKGRADLLIIPKETGAIKSETLG
ncbi:MAG: hypothetical protein B7Y25_05460 [Alphaproteobacteria bacterium 16-39-46]|nr:MAG: hypothetical protein B7Y25_05460 [Alphaproteobacteria bacterium 16-39-46]OZA44262.1 MAG: hypothetical protein B7X84_00790 [Alphaproteobacteria bacterium 17-39-52]HQS84382.1 AAA family ATPase [Alphaproteobacteria bacterium]HQS94207.1 AAA family ATPase [Alphaproteobacteria bacterium]